MHFHTRGSWRHLLGSGIWRHAPGPVASSAAASSRLNPVKFGPADGSGNAIPAKKKNNNNNNKGFY